MDLTSNDFELFGIEPRFAVDPDLLDARWRALQGQVHPDRFAAAGAAAQRVAMQWAVRVNEAYRRLKDPVQRAAYLCELQGVPIDAERNTAMPAGFLTQQLRWREALEDAASIAEVEALAAEVAAHGRAELARLATLLDEQRDYAAAAGQVRALMFSERYARDIDRRLEALGQ
ncbi:MAG: Fe-S protein assembly co-chaperone HscB [Pseudomonadota bacterium]|nr:Fe-S protein assembly co-chaperone HscB [Pseudomonadota bacterium]